jgi:hypothetical protein
VSLRHAEATWRSVRALIYRLADAPVTGATPWPDPAYAYQATRWARFRVGPSGEQTVAGIAEHRTLTTFEFHDLVSLEEDDVLVIGTTAYLVVGIGDPRGYTPGKVRAVEAIRADKASYVLVGP